MSKKLLVGIVAVFAIYLVATPFITVNQMRTAAESQNNDELAEHIELPSVRQSLKDQMNTMLMKKVPAEMEGNPLAALGAAFAGAIVDKIVDAYVTPSGIAQLMSGEKLELQEDHKSGNKSAKQPLSDADMSYQSFDKFVVTIKNSSGEEQKFVLRRRGIDWKLTEIIIPQTCDMSTLFRTQI